MHVLDELHHLEIKKKNRIVIKDFNNRLSILQQKLIRKKLQLFPTLWYIKNESGSENTVTSKLIKKITGVWPVNESNNETTNIISKKDKNDAKPRQVIIKFLRHNDSDINKRKQNHLHCVILSRE